MPGYSGTNAAIRQVQAQQNNPWYQVQVISSLLSKIKFLQFSIQAERTLAANELQTMVSLTPYAVQLDNEQDSSTNIRFPIGVLYINGGLEPYNSYFQNLASSLNFKDRIGEKTMVGNFAGPSSTQNSFTPPVMPILSSSNDASQAFYNTITAFQNSISSNNLLFDQTAFEDYYQITWSTSLYYIDSKGNRFGNKPNRCIVFDQAKTPNRQKAIILDYTDDDDDTPIVCVKRSAVINAVNAAEKSSENPYKLSVKD